METLNTNYPEVATDADNRGCNGEGFSSRHNPHKGTSIYGYVDRFDDYPWVLKDCQQLAIGRGRDLSMKEQAGLHASCTPPKLDDLFISHTGNIFLARNECCDSGLFIKPLGSRLMYDLELDQSFIRSVLCEGIICPKPSETDAFCIEASPDSALSVSIMADNELRGTCKSPMPKLLEFWTRKGP
ncbi:hypothetical protein REPUB_Repub05bG0100700 [Reevesia pubescens]